MRWTRWTEGRGDKLRSTLQLLIDQIDPEFRNSEKLNKLVQEMLQSTGSTSTSGDSEATTEKSPEKKKRKGGKGRTPAAQIKGAEVISCPHKDLKHGARCPECTWGKVYHTVHKASLDISVCEIFVGRPSGSHGTDHTKTVPSYLRSPGRIVGWAPSAPSLSKSACGSSCSNSQRVCIICSGQVGDQTDASIA